MATEIVLAIGVVLAAEWLFVRVTGALQVPIPPRTPACPAAELWMLNHALTVIAMMLGAILALIGGFGIGMFGTARAQLLLLLYLPLPMLALLAVGLSVHVRVVSLALLAVVLAVGTYCRRFGPPGFMGGMLAFMGAFLGFFIRTGRDNPVLDDTALDNPGKTEFQPQVFTFGGWLPGSANVAGAASLERGGSGLIERIRLAPYARIAIQMGIAVSGAIIAGDALSGRRFYWAVIAAFITFMGANTAGEQLRKSVFRVAGTVVGVIAGSVLAHLVGDRVWLQITVVLVSLFLGLYLFRVNYAFMTIGITVMVSQLYVELDEFSNNLLILRLGETAVGAGVAILTVLLVLPLHVGRVARVAARQQLEALADLADRCLDRLADPASAAGSDLELRAAARRVDVSYQALVATVRPMRTPLFGSFAARVAGFTATAAAARHYARNLLLDASTRYADLDARATDGLAAARRQLADSVAAVTGALAPAAADGGQAPPGRRYVRSASLFARVADALPGEPLTSRPQLALRDAQLLDGALAEAARWAGVPVSDLDTVPR